MQLFALLFTVFIDSLGFGLVFPIFSPLIINNEGGIFDPSVSLTTRGVVFGLLVSVYCIGQFLGGPLFGSLSDRVGRKKVLVGAMWVGALGYVIGAFGLVMQSLWILFISRVLVGLSAGTFPVAQSVIADRASVESKGRQFGLIGMACWTGFVVGPFVGGRLYPFGSTVPFIAASLFCFLSSISLLFFLKTVLIKAETGRMRLLKGVLQLKYALFRSPLKGLFFVMFIFSMGWGIFTEFSPIFLTRRLGFAVTQIADFYAWVGCCIAISQGLLMRPILKWFSPQRLLRFGLLSMGMLLPLMLLVRGSMGLFWLVPFIALCQALIFPVSATLVSNATSAGKQGEMLGIHNSVQWAAIAFPPLFSGGIVAKYPHLVVIVGSFCMMVAFILFLLTSKKIVWSPAEVVGETPQEPSAEE